MVRARGGKTNTGSRKQNKSVVKHDGSKETPTKKRTRKSRKKKQSKFAEYAKNFADISDSDSDHSVQSEESINSSINSDFSYKRPFNNVSYVRRSVTPEPMPVVTRPLLLPQSSRDLLIETEDVMKALHVYEIVRHFWRVLRISPSSFEDFCAALNSREQCSIMTEIHVSLLKLLIADDESNQVLYGNAEEKDMVNIHLYLIDAFTWPEILRTYINSNPDYHHMSFIVNDNNFPLVSAKSKLEILCMLADNVLSLNTIREEIANEGLFISDDHCRKCGRMGDLLCCELCPSVYHLECLSPPLLKVPEDEWLCPVCNDQTIKGVSDVLFELDRIQVYRNEPLGTDRHNRTYWFMVRKIIVEGNLDIFYYSCQKHFDELLSALRDDEKETELVSVLEDRYDEIVRHMKITEELYQEKKGDLVPYIMMPRDSKLVESKDFELYKKQRQEEEAEAEKQSLKEEEEERMLRLICCPDLKFVHDSDVVNTIHPFDEEHYQAVRAAQLNGCQVNLMKINQADKFLDDESIVADVISVCVSKVCKLSGEETIDKVKQTEKRSELDQAIDKEFQTFKKEIKTKNTFEAAVELDVEARTKGGVEKEKADSSTVSEVGRNNSDDKLLKPLNAKDYFKLGMGNGFTLYKNQFSVHFLAKGKCELQAEKDKRRSLGYKFCLNDFRWNGQCQNGLQELKATLRSSMLSFESSLPTAFLHPVWYKQLPCWIRAVRLCNTVEDFASLLLMLEEMIKPVIMVTTWKESCGTLKLRRVVGEVKNKIKTKKPDKESELIHVDDSGSEDEVIEPTVLVPVKFSWVPRHTIWEQKGEEYRITGVGAWCWQRSKKGKKKYPTRDKKKNIEKVLRRVKLKKGTQFVKKDSLNVIESAPEEFDRRDEEEPTSPRIFIKRLDMSQISAAKNIKTPVLEFSNSVSGGMTKGACWSEDTLMEVMFVNESNIGTVTVSIGHTKTNSSVNSSFPGDNVCVNSGTTEKSSVDNKDITIKKIEKSVLPSAPYDVKASSNSQPVNHLKETELKDLSNSACVSKLSVETNELLTKQNGVEVNSIEKDNKKSTGIVSTLCNSESSITSVVSTTAFTQSSFVNTQKSTPSKTISEISSLEQATTVSTSTSTGSTQTSAITVSSLTTVAPIQTTSSVCLPLSTVRTVTPTPTISINASKAEASIHVHKKSGTPAYLGAAGSTLNSPATLKIISSTREILPKKASTVISLPSVGMGLTQNVMMTPNRLVTVNNSDKQQPVLANSSILNTPVKLPLPRVTSKGASPTVVQNAQPVIINGGNNAALMQALAAAGIKPNDSGIVAFRTSTGHFVIKTGKKGELSSQGSIILRQSNASVSRMATPNSIITASPKIITGLSQVRPQTITPGVASVTKGTIQPKLPGNGFTTLVNSVNQIKTSNNPIVSPASGGNTKVAKGGVFSPNNPKKSFHTYDEDFYNSAHTKMKYLSPVFQKPEALLSYQVKRLKDRRRGIKSVFMLKDYHVQRVARQGGFSEVGGYLYNCKPSLTWPESLPRPTFQMAWRYRLTEARHIATVGHLLRMLHCCLKWDVLNNKPPKGVNRAVTSNKGIMTVEILHGEPLTSDGLIYRYKVKKNYQPFKVNKKPKPEKPVTPVDTTPKFRGSATGIKLRDRVTPMKYSLDGNLSESSSEDESGEPFPKERTTIESWIDESSLDLWEIRHYWERVENERNQKRNQELTQKQVIQKQKVSSLVQARKDIIQKYTSQDLAKRNQASPRYQILPKQTINSSPLHTSRLTISPVNKQVITKPSMFPAMKSYQANLLNKYAPSLSNRVTSRGSKPTVLLSRAGSTPPVQNRLGKGNVPLSLTNKKLYTDPAYFISKSVVDSIIKKIESSEKKEKRKVEKLANVLQKQREQEAARLYNLLVERKERLKLQILRKRELLETVTLRNVQDEIERELGFSEGEPSVIDRTDEIIALALPKTSKKKTDLKRKKSESQDETVPEAKKKKKQNMKNVEHMNVDEKLYCVCKTPYDNTKFYVGCDLCNDWFHGSCVGITEDMALTIDEFMCEDCSRQKETVEEQELYCLCKQPYDDSKFYVGCDFCQDWFHGTCVGITQSEADLIEEYKCPNCCKKNDQDLIEMRELTAKELDGLRRLYRSLLNHKMAWPFLKPVNAKEVTDYYTKIKEPMDLQTMNEKLRAKKYKTLTDFVADVSRIFDNCRYYNPTDSSFYRCAEVLENFFVQKLKGFKNTLKTNK